MSKRYAVPYILRVVPAYKRTLCTGNASQKKKKGKEKGKGRKKERTKGRGKKETNNVKAEAEILLPWSLVCLIFDVLPYDKT